jgi:hypothetical protein
VAALEVVVAAAVVISDFFVATLIVLPLVAISLALQESVDGRPWPRIQQHRGLVSCYLVGPIYEL